MAAADPTIKTVTFSEAGKLGIDWDGRNQITRVKAVSPGGQADRLGVSAGDVLVNMGGAAVAPDTPPKAFMGLMSSPVATSSCGQPKLTQR